MTTALALGALAIPTVALAASNHSNGGSNAGGSRGNVSVAAPSTGGSSLKANVSGTAKVPATQSVAVNKNGPINSNTKSWNGQWASNGRHHHHRHHDRDFRFVPFAAYDDYAAYDDCWQTILTPSGYHRVYVCEQNGYY
jgi:hypothetical protein